MSESKLKFKVGDAITKDVQNQAVLEVLVGYLYKSGRLTGENVAFDEKLLQKYYDKNGIGPMETIQGGRKLEAVEKLRAEWLDSKDKHKMRIAQITPLYTQVNLGLDDGQYAMYLDNNNHYQRVFSGIVKEYGDGKKQAARIVFELVDRRNRIIPNHLVAVIGNVNREDPEEYKEYLAKVGASACRWMWHEYELIRDDPLRKPNQK